MIERDNQLIQAFPDVTWAVHLCRGNHRSMWSVEGGYDAIAEQLFNDLAVRPDLRRVRLAASRARSSRCASCPTTRSSCSD